MSFKQIFLCFFAMTIATKARGQLALANMGRNVSLKCPVLVSSVDRDAWLSLTNSPVWLLGLSPQPVEPSVLLQAPTILPAFSGFGHDPT
jgi:hypothetical protein